MSTDTLVMNSAVRGYHVYAAVWEPEVGDTFLGQSEMDNAHDHYAVATFRTGDTEEIVGHLPREFSRIAYYFLLHGGTIQGIVTGKRIHSWNAGGMEIWCELWFIGVRKHVEKLRRIFEELELSASVVDYLRS